MHSENKTSMRLKFFLELHRTAEFSGPSTLLTTATPSPHPPCIRSNSAMISGISQFPTSPL